MTISVRRVRAEDWQRLKAVRLAALAESPPAFGSTLDHEVAFDDAVWRQRAANTRNATFFAVDPYDVVGLVTGVDEEPLHLVSMWTAPHVRRRGAGRALVQAVLDWAGDRRVELWVTRGNDAAHALYEAMGFVDTDDVRPLPSDPGKEEIRMVRVSAGYRQMEPPSRWRPAMS